MTGETNSLLLSGSRNSNENGTKYSAVTAAACSSYSNNKKQPFENPTTSPAGPWVSFSVTLCLLPLVLLMAVLSVPINGLMWLIHMITAPSVRRRLKSLEKDEWMTQTGRLYDWLRQNRNDKNKNNNTNILIIGGGIGGLSLAHFLIKCGVTGVKVFEKHADCGWNRGGGHGLLAGTWCFDKMGMTDVFDETCEVAYGWSFDNGRGTKAFIGFRLYDHAWLPAVRFRVGSFVRSDFLRYLADALPSHVLHTEHELVGVEEESNGTATVVKATFANGQSYQGSLLVGCDGSKSRVRDFMVRSQQTVATTDADATPFYVNMNVWWSVTRIVDIPPSDKEAMTADGFLWEITGGGPNRRYIESGAIMTLFAQGHIVMVLDYRSPSLRTHHHDWAGNATNDGFVRFMKSWNVPRMFHPVAHYAMRVSHFAVPKGLRRPPEEWYNRHVVLLGDAVHPTPHFFGQGANAAVQDAYCLTRLLCTCDDTKSALQTYVKVRMPPADAIVSKSYMLGLTETAGGAARVVRDLLFFTLVKTGLFVWIMVDLMAVRV